MEKKRLVVLTGAGMSAESGISTFRDNGGLWDRYNVEDVATPEGWLRDPEMVTEFYNIRRKELLNVEPCLGHRLLALLEEFYEIDIITQNVDNLHERAGSSNVLHLHGELMKVTSSDNPNDSEQIIELDEEHAEIEYGEEAPDGSPLRPFIVWFGESVPNIDIAAEICSNADIMLVVGTSLNVYPAAGLTSCAPPDIPIYLVDPASVRWNSQSKVHHIQMGASKGIAEFIKQQNLK